MLCVQKFVGISGEARLIIITLYALFSWLEVILSICIMNIMLVWYIFATFPQFLTWNYHLISVLQLGSPSQFLLWNSNKNTNKSRDILTNICFKSVKPSLHFKDNIFRSLENFIVKCLYISCIHTSIPSSSLHSFTRADAYSEAF